MKSLWIMPLGLAVLLPLAGRAADWPQWRGPQRNGISAETRLLKEWPAAGPKLLWQLNDIGDGYSTPAVVGARLYVMSNRGIDNEFVQALEIKDGKQAWSTRIGKVGPNRGPQYPGSRSTPTVDGAYLYALGSDGDLDCLETASGKMRWHKDLRTDFAGQPGAWAYAESPLIDGDVLVCTPGGNKATIVALNKNTGALVWKSEIPGGDQAAYASVIVAEVDGVRQYVQFLQKGVVGVDARTGKFLWRYNQTAQGSPANIPTPVTHGGYVYSSTGRGGGGLIKLKVAQGTVEAEPIYYMKDLPTSIGGVVVLGEELYGTNGRGLLCADFATGKTRWQNKCIGAGSICFADGCLYVHGENGQVALVEATPESYREKGRFTPPNQPNRGRSQAWTYPVVANGRLYLRDFGSLWCYDISGPAAGN